MPKTTLTEKERENVATIKEYLEIGIEPYLNSEFKLEHDDDGRVLASLDFGAGVVVDLYFDISGDKPLISWAEDCTERLTFGNVWMHIAFSVMKKV